VRRKRKGLEIKQVKFNSEPEPRKATVEYKQYVYIRGRTYGSLCLDVDEARQIREGLNALREIDEPGDC
jgi:hypothetical protein